MGNWLKCHVCCHLSTTCSFWIILMLHMQQFQGPLFRVVQNYLRFEQNINILTKELIEVIKEEMRLTDETCIHMNIQSLDMSHWIKMEQRVYCAAMPVDVMTLVGIVSPFLLSRQLYLVISCYSVSNNYFLYIEHSITRNKEINTC